MKGDLKFKIFIRVDGGASIGLGHLFRCLALAQMLGNRFELCFICKVVPDGFTLVLNEKGFTYYVIETETEFLNMIRLNCIVVLDGYQFTTDLQTQIKKTGAKLVCIDDLHDQEYVADLIINHAPGISAQNYSASLYTQFALGLDFSLLRPAFLEQARKKRNINGKDTILICFGGADPKNLTYSTLQAVVKFQEIKSIVVVTGLVYNITEEFNHLIESDSRIHHCYSLNEVEMLDVMMQCDLAIVPASGILFEVLSAGCIVISGMYVENQQFVYENFKNAALFVDAGSFDSMSLTTSIKNVLKENFPQINPIDGQSSARLVKLFKQMELEYLVCIRAAKDSDENSTFEWATNPEIRRYSFQSHIITREEHSNWFKRKIQNSDCYFGIAEMDGNLIGSIRFDIHEEEALISYLLDPGYHGKGLGQVLLKNGIEWFVKNANANQVSFKVISGEVMEANIASIKAFERLGFLKRKNSVNLKFEKQV